MALRKPIKGEIAAFPSNSKMELLLETGKKQFFILTNPLMHLHIGDFAEFEFNEKGLITFGKVVDR